MGYLVATTGRLLLPANLEKQALTVAEHRMSSRGGHFDPDTAADVDTLAQLASYAGVTLARDGDWLSVSTDHAGVPKWSEQAEEFYHSLARFVQEGEVHLRGEDGTTWSYVYSSGGLQRHAGGTDTESSSSADPAAGSAAGPQPSSDPGSPGPSSPGSGSDQPPSERPPSEQPPSEQPPSEQPPSGQPSTEPNGPGFIDYPGRERRAPRASRSDRSTPGGPTTPPGVQDAGWAGVDDDPPPAPPGRVLLMTVAFVVGIALIIGLALLASGF